MNKNTWIKNLNPVSIGTTVAVLFVFSLSLFFYDFFFNILSWIQNVFVLNFSWFYVLLVFCLFCLCLYLAFGPYGHLRLGRLTQPKYSLFTWIAMLFSAGMGTGLLFSAVWEPLYHWFFPESGPSGSLESLDRSFQITFLHWGFAGWAVYTFMGLSIAFLSFRKGLPLKISSLLHPLLKGKVNGVIGSGIDILASTAILCGVATTLGRGTLQINSGLKEMLNIPFSNLTQTLIIIAITFIATCSLLSGLNRGIRRLSELNILLCLLLMVFVFCFGPTVKLLNSFVEYFGAYLQNTFSIMTQVESLGSVEWRSQWTVFYWAWWIAWSPFVGIFIARISEGRTLRQFVCGVLLIPSLLSCLWFTVFGGTAIHKHIETTMNLKALVKTEYSVLTFKFLEHFPFGGIVSFVALFTVVVFFVTSSDSASYVIHSISSGHTKANKTALWTKVYWSSLEGVLALLIVLTGGMKSLELLVIISAFPFAVLMCFIAYSLLKELKQL